MTTVLLVIGTVILATLALLVLAVRRLMRHISARLVHTHDAR